MHMRAHKGSSTHGCRLHHLRLQARLGSSRRPRLLRCQTRPYANAQYLVPLGVGVGAGAGAGARGGVGAHPNGVLVYVLLQYATPATTHYLLLTTYYLRLTTYDLRLTTYDLLLTTYYKYHSLPAASCCCWVAAHPHGILN
jgi:hypothetical protein